MAFVGTCLALLLASCHGWQSHYGYESGDSEYIHSNDTMKLELEDNMVLRGIVGSEHTLRFRLTNEGRAGHFTIR